MGNEIPKLVKKDIVDGYAAETLYACLLTNAFPNTPGTYDVYGDLSAWEVADGNGYSTGGKALTGKLGSYTGTTNAMLDADNVAWTNATFSAVKFVVVYNYLATKKIRGIYMFNADKSVTSGTFTVEWNSSGLLKIS